MSDSEKTDNTVIKNARCLHLIKELPCPAYIVRSDSVLTICGSNQAFMELFDCDEKKLRYQFGSKLSAMIDSGPYLRALSSGSETPFQHKLRRADGERILNTYLRHKDGDSEEADFIICVSFDVTGYALAKRSLAEYNDMVRLTSLFAKCEVFEWFVETRQVHVYSQGLILDSLKSEISVNTVKEQLLRKFGSQGSRTEFLDVWDRAEIGTVDQECEIPWYGQDRQSRWCRLALIHRASYRPGNKRIVGIFQDITKEKNVSMSYLRETRFYHILLAEKMAYGHADITEDRILMVGGLWTCYSDLLDKITYSQVVEEFINKIVHPDDRAQYLEIMRKENLFRSYDLGIDQLSCEFRRIVEQNKMVWMCVTIRLFQEPGSGHLVALLYLTNIDELKRLKQAKPAANPIYEEDTKQAKAVNAFDTVVGTQGDMAYLVDPDTYNLICANKAFYDRIGKTSEECKGMKCYQAMHKRETPCPFCGKANCTSGKFYMWRDLNTTLEQEFLIKNKMIRWKGRDALLALAVDISNDKSIGDSVGSFDSESHVIISAMEHLSNCDTLVDAMKSVMEVIGFFYRADSVSFWEVPRGGQFYDRTIYWEKAGRNTSIDKEDRRCVTRWLNSRQWKHPIMLESPEAALKYSYELYLLMQKHESFNHRWSVLQKGEEEYGYLLISNTRSKLENTSFLESISTFIVEEIRKRRLWESVLHANAHDKMTDLLNRNSYEQYMHNFNPDEIASVGVLVANMDNLKGINAIRGDQTGNYYIKRFVGILQDLFAGHLIYRLNGDEFLVIAVDINRRDLEDLIRKLVTRLKRREDYSVSIGYAWDNVEKILSDLIPEAVAAMKRNKEKYYKENGLSNNLEHGKMAKVLMVDLEKGLYQIYLQPKMNMKTGKLVGAEALIRHIDEGNHVIPPSEFIPVMESNQLIRYIDLFVFEEVCRLLEQWKKQFGVQLLISLNFSRQTLFEEDILQNVEQILEKYDIDRNYIEIEITESVVAGDRGSLYQAAQDFYQAGYKVSLDDFGVKYTNLSMLANIDFHTLKLDKSLIKALGMQENNQVILKNIVHLCKDLKINVIAEGVETQKQMEILNGLGCYVGQGYLLGKPMPVEEFELLYLNGDN